MTRRPPNPFAGDDPPPEEPHRPEAPERGEGEPKRDERGAAGPAWGEAERPEPASPRPGGEEGRAEFSRPDTPGSTPRDDGRPQRGQIPVIETLREAAALVNQNRRTVLLPLAVVSIPAALVSSILSALLFLTVWREHSPTSLGTVDTETPGVVIFAVLVLAAVEILFALVGRAATIVAIAGAKRGEAPTLAESLDPAFSRIGGLLLMVGVLVLAAGLLTIPIIGLFIGFYLLLRLAVAFEAFMVEETGAMESLGRSWAVMRGNMLRLLGLVALAMACVLPIILVGPALSSVIGGGRTATILLLTISSAVQTVIAVPVVAFLTACTTLYFLKARRVEDDGDPA